MTPLPHPTSCPSRRAVLGLAGAGSAAALTGCSGSEPPTTGSTSPGGGEGSAPVDAGPVEDLAVGSAVRVDQQGVQAVVSRPTADTVVAFSPVCPHQGCTVTPGDGLYVCPCHSSQFDLATGEVLSGPAETGLEPYPAGVEDGRIVLG
ncbi:Rieske 2Fe-2S domain-containing protein [Kocuria kalidii]|uniref:Rieske (2Fe-2S) protein n=1 Tax=Kocuria kalidii TaxID=3376283 RepID=UPI0037B6C50B